MIGRVHARRLARVGLEVRDPQQTCRRGAERRRHIGYRAGREHAREQRARSQQHPVRLLDRLEHRGGHEWPRRAEAQMADLLRGGPDRRLAVKQHVAGVGDQRDGLGGRRQHATCDAELLPQPFSRVANVAEGIGHRANHQVAQRMPADPVDRQGPGERASKHDLVVGQCEQRPSQVTDRRSLAAASQLSRGAAVVRDRHDHRELGWIIRQRAQHRGQAVPTPEHGDPPARRRGTTQR